jgi:hypothetical protein
MVGCRLLAISIACLLTAGPNGAVAQGMFGAPPPNAPADSAPTDDGAANSAPAASAPDDSAAPTNPPAAAVPPAPILPGSPTAVVRPFYNQVGLEVDPAERGLFIDPAKTVLNKSDALRKSGQGECLDPNMALDNADFDKDDIDKSLKTIEAIKGDKAKVVVAFVVAGSPHRLEWEFNKVGGDWKITDLLSITGQWALSQYQCE